MNFYAGFKDLGDYSRITKTSNGLSLELNDASDLLCSNDLTCLKHI